MAEDLSIISGTKKEQYESLLPQINGLLTGEPDLVANLANIVAALKEQFNWLWVGFYLVKENELVLAPCCLYENTQGQRSLRNKLGKSKDYHRSGC